MSVIIGSARIDEHGSAHGGSAGDQKQTSKPDFRGEVSMQDFYVHSKGWYIFRAKKSSHRKKLAKAMKQACNNPNIGYDQYQRDGVVSKGTNTKTKTECDCSSLVRRCIIEATGKDVGNIRTATMPDMLTRSGLFEPQKSYTSGTNLLTGDILVTKVSGHTVIVVEGNDSDSKVAHPTLKKGSTGAEVKKLQKNLNSLGCRDEKNAKLQLDGDFGAHTDAALRKFQKAYKIEVDGIYGMESYKTMEKALG